MTSMTSTVVRSETRERSSRSIGSSIPLLSPSNERVFARPAHHTLTAASVSDRRLPPHQHAVAAGARAGNPVENATAAATNLPVGEIGTLGIGAGGWAENGQVGCS